MTNKKTEITLEQLKEAGFNLSFDFPKNRIGKLISRDTEIYVSVNNDYVTADLYRGSLRITDTFRVFTMEDIVTITNFINGKLP